MFNIIDFIKSRQPYKIQGENNKVYIIENGQKKELKHKIKGLNITIIGNNNYVELHMPITFISTSLKIEGDYSKFTMKSTTTRMINTLLYMESYGEIFIDEDSRFNARNARLCANNNINGVPHKIHIGKHVQVGEGIIIRTSDGHSLYNLGEEEPYNSPQDVIIGDNVWFGARCMVLKGSEIQSNSIVGAGAIVNKKFKDSNIIIAGNPAKIIKRNVRWERISYGDFYNKKNQP